MKALASAFFVDLDTTIAEPSYESHMETQNCSLHIHPDLMDERIYLDLGQFCQSHQDLESQSQRYSFRTKAKHMLSLDIVPKAFELFEEQASASSFSN
jgi:hypothetical protein